MSAIRIKTFVESETLVLPEIAPFVGRTVEIRVNDVPASAFDQLLDNEYHEECEADDSPEATLAEVRASLAGISESMSAEILAAREDR